MRHGGQIRGIAALGKVRFHAVGNPFTLVTITQYTGAKNSALNAL
jgi:hypothetical protein